MQHESGDHRSNLLRMHKSTLIKVLLRNKRSIYLRLGSKSGNFTRGKKSVT